MGRSELQKIPSYCAYETQNTFNTRVVSYESATHLCNRRFDPVDADHFGIAKPQDVNSQPYTLFKANYKEVFERLPTQNEQSSEALVFNRPGGTIDLFVFDHNVAIGVPEIIDNQGHIGQASIHDNMIDNAVDTRCRSRPRTQGANPGAGQLPTDNEAVPHSNAARIKMEYSVFLQTRENNAPFYVFNRLVVRNYDGTYDLYFDVQMDNDVECEYLIVAMRAPGLINFWVVKDQNLVGIDQVPIAGFTIKRITNPRGAFTFGVRHKDAAVHLDVKTWWN